MDPAELILLFASATEYRRPKVFENILIGKKTVSNLYWGLQYGMLPELGVLHGRNLKITSTSINQLREKKLIEVNENGAVKLTDEGQIQHTALQSVVPPIAAADKLATVNIDRFRNRILLAAQITSEYVHHNNQYYPVTNQLFDTFTVKQWFKQTKERLPDVLIQPLTTFLTRLNNDTWADMVVGQMVGHEYGGQTNQQLAQRLQIPIGIIELVNQNLFLNLALTFLREKSPDTQSLLAGIVNSDWTQSSQLTYQLFINQRLTVKQIAVQRRIKESTVREHLLESAIWQSAESFPYRQLISEANWQLFSQESTLTDIQLPPNSPAVFFEFRLYQIYRSKFNDG